MPVNRTLALSMLGIAAVGLIGCKPGDSAQKQNEKARASTMERATKAVPVPHTSNFQNRQAVAEYMRRMDDPSKTFYTYLLSYTGKVIGYYVTRTHPVSVCQLMTPPKKEYYTGSGADPLGPAPTLDGLYSGGGECGHYYAFTADTDTLVEFSTDFFISDQPLGIEADKLSAQ